MRIVTLSDTHGYHYYIGKTSPSLPEGDVIVHAGDFTGRGKLYEMIEFAKWFGGLDYERAICIAGNHDEVAENMGYEATKDLFWEHGVIYLCDSECIIEGIKFYGTPYVPEFCGWSFMEYEYQLEKRYAKILRDTDVLITHGPAWGILDNQAYDLDFKNTGEIIRTGSKALLPYVNYIDLSAHIFGHIHEGRGRIANQVNASFLDLNYNPYNKVQEVIEI